MLPITLKSTQLFTVFKLATGGNVFLVFFLNTNEEKLKKKLSVSNRSCRFFGIEL